MKSINTLIENTPEKKSINLIHQNTKYTTISPTQTGLNKSIMDAVHRVREFLETNNIHDYDSQQLGPEYKIVLSGKFIYLDRTVNTNISLYRSNGRGDYRIWFSGLAEFASANDELAITLEEDVINIYNLSKYNYPNFQNTES